MAEDSKQFVTSFFLPQQGRYFLINPNDDLQFTDICLFTVDSNENVKTATLEYAGLFDTDYFTLAFGPSVLVANGQSFEGSANLEYYDIRYPPTYMGGYSYSGDVISAASPFSYGLDSGANAFAFGIGSSPTNLFYFFQMRLKGSSAVVADTKLTESAVAQGLWSTTGDYFELDPTHNWISSHSDELGFAGFYSEAVPEPRTSGVALSAIAGASGSWIRRKRRTHPTQLGVLRRLLA